MNRQALQGQRRRLRRLQNCAACAASISRWYSSAPQHSAASPAAAIWRAARATAAMSTPNSKPVRRIGARRATVKRWTPSAPPLAPAAITARDIRRARAPLMATTQRHDRARVPWAASPRRCHETALADPLRDTVAAPARMLRRAAEQHAPRARTQARRLAKAL